MAEFVQTVASQQVPPPYRFPDAKVRAFIWEPNMSAVAVSRSAGGSSPSAPSVKSVSAIHSRGQGAAVETGRRPGAKLVTAASFRT